MSTRPPMRSTVTHAILLLLPAALFVLDWRLPQTPTPAIGYCAVVVLATGVSGRRRVIGVAAACTLLTWIAYRLDAPYAPAWIGFFDRSIVTAVIWLTAMLGLTRQRARDELARKADELEQRSRELARSNAELDKFAAIVSHDLRSPLMSLSSCAQLLREQHRGKLEGDAHELIDVIQGSAVRMNEMIRGVLAYSRAGSEGLRPEECSCETIVKQVLADLETELKKHDAQVTHDPLPFVRADRVHLARLFQNLIENGVKYRGPEAPHVHLSARADDGEWIISVRDNGMGIEPRHYDKIFQMFGRLHGGDSGYAGVGIGLAVCKRIIERHSGRIWVDSQPGQGSTFSFTLPA